LATGIDVTRMPVRPVNSSSERTSGASGSSSSAVASPIRIADGRRRHPVGPAQPVDRPAAADGPGGGVGPAAAGELGDRRKQHLLDGSLDRAHRQRGLHRAVGAFEFERGERADQDVRIAAQGLPRAGHGGRDRQPVAQRVAQRRDLAVDVDAVLAGRALGLRVVEATLPGAERIRTHVEHRGRF
jgi:hypothetical protein